MATQVWRVGVKVYGKKKRARKIEWHSSVSNFGTDLLELPGEASLEHLAAEGTPKCKDWIKANISEVKPFVPLVRVAGNEPASVVMTFTKWTIDGAGSAQWEPFNKDHNIKIAIDDAWGLK